MVALEPAIRGRLRERFDVSSVQTKRRRGFPPAAREHRLVAEAAQLGGPDWVDHLSEICAALEKKVIIPKRWRTHCGCDSWRDVAEAIERDSGLRASLAKYIQYRIRWCEKNNSA
jgi:hypothetical protein